MSELLKTTLSKGRGSHYHIAYIKSDGSGITSNDGNHSHDIIPDGIGGFLLTGQTHTHALVPYEIAEQKDNRTDQEKVDHVITLYMEARDRELDSRKAALECEDFYANKQWDLKIVRQLDEEKRSHHTVNKLRSPIEVLSGYQRQNRTDIKFLPAEEGDQAIADILNIVVKKDLENCNYAREETKVFKDMCVDGRGLFNVYMDFDRNIAGNVTVEKFKWDECYLGPHEKEDLSDCDYVIKTKWYSLNNLKGMFPEKLDDLQPETDSQRQGITTLELMSENGKNYRLFEAWERRHKRAFVLVNGNDEFTYDAFGWSEADINKVKTIPGFYKIPRNFYTLYITKVISNKFLEETVSDIEDYPIVPAYAEYRNGKFWGKIEESKDLQRLINKCYSQFTDIINKMSNYLYYYDRETFESKKDADRFQRQASTPGAVVKVNNVDKPPKKEEGIKFPVELVNAIAMFNNDLKEVMNVHLELMGEGSETQSGIAMKQRIVQQLIGNDYLFDNLSFAKKQIGRQIVKLIQKYYTPERILRIVENQNKKQKVEIAGQPLDAFSRDMILEFLRESDFSKYDVEIAESPYSPSSMMGSFLMLMELAGKGVQIPPEAIIQFAPIPQKEKIMQQIESAMAQQREMENKKFQTEIAKTMIAKNAQEEKPVESVQ